MNAIALPALPLLAEAFSQGELSYSKVRALTRIADAQNEETLLDWARTGTASHIETLVRKYRRADRLLENERAEEREASRGLTTWYDTDGMLGGEGRRTPWRRGRPRAGAGTASRWWYTWTARCWWTPRPMADASWRMARPSRPTLRG